MERFNQFQQQMKPIVDQIHLLEGYGRSLDFENYLFIFVSR